MSGSSFCNRVCEPPETNSSSLLRDTKRFPTGSPALPTRRYDGHLRNILASRACAVKLFKNKATTTRGEERFSSYDGFDRGFTGRLEWSCGNTIVLKSCVLKKNWDLYSSEDFALYRALSFKSSHSSFLSSCPPRGPGYPS
jgi:hypothetical protein